jgi:hypothetical protein
MGRGVRKIAIVASSAAAVVLAAAMPAMSHAAIVTCGFTTPFDCNWNSLIDMANNIMNFLIGLGTLIAAIIIGYGGILMLVHSSNGGKKAEVKKMIWDVVVGFTIMLCAFLIVKLILTTLGVTIRAPGL